MSEHDIAKPKRRAKPLYHAAKISNHRFRKVLLCFVHDFTATDAALVTGLSVNSVNAMFHKIRVYFYEAGLFLDFYGGSGEAQYSPEADQEFEASLLAFHLNRLRSRRGVTQKSGEPDYHLAESWWRLDFAMIMRERPSNAVYDMMFRRLLAVIRVAGPIGKKPQNPEGRCLLIADLIDQKIRWLQRNAAGFAAPELRDTLHETLQLFV